MKLIDIYRRGKKLDQMVDLCRSLVVKHKQSGKCWIELLNCLMEWHEVNAGKEEKNNNYNVKKKYRKSIAIFKEA